MKLTTIILLCIGFGAGFMCKCAPMVFLQVVIAGVAGWTLYKIIQLCDARKRRKSWGLYGRWD